MAFFVIFTICLQVFHHHQVKSKTFNTKNSGIIAVVAAVHRFVSLHRIVPIDVERMQLS